MRRREKKVMKEMQRKSARSGVDFSVDLDDLPRDEPPAEENDPVVGALWRERKVSSKLSYSEGGVAELNSGAFEAPGASVPAERAALHALGQEAKVTAMGGARGSAGAAAAPAPDKRSLTEKRAALSAELQLEASMPFGQTVELAARELELGAQVGHSLVGQLDACLAVIETCTADAAHLAHQLGLEDGLPLKEMARRSVQELNLSSDVEAMSLVRQLEACVGALERDRLGKEEARPPELLNVVSQARMQQHLVQQARNAQMRLSLRQDEASAVAEAEAEAAAADAAAAAAAAAPSHAVDLGPSFFSAAAFMAASVDPAVTARADRRREAAATFGGNAEWWVTPRGTATLLVGKGLDNGVGLKAWSSGVMYDGAWKDGVRHGYGRFTWANGLNTYDGLWEEDFPHGQGRVTLGDGSTHVGEFYMGVRHGPGEEKGADGVRRQGTWESDEGFDLTLVEEDESMMITAAQLSLPHPPDSVTEAGSPDRNAKKQEVEERLAQLRAQRRRKLMGDFHEPEPEPEPQTAAETWSGLQLQPVEQSVQSESPGLPARSSSSNRGLPPRAYSSSPRVRAIEEELEEMKQAKAQRLRERNRSEQDSSRAMSPKHGIRGPPGTVVHISSLPRDPAKKEAVILSQVHQLLDAAFPAAERKSMALDTLARSPSPRDAASPARTRPLAPPPSLVGVKPPPGLTFMEEMLWIKEHKDQGGQVATRPVMGPAPDEMEKIKKIQAVHRGKVARQEIAQQHAAAEKIQARVRGTQHRRKARNMRARAEYAAKAESMEVTLQEAHAILHDRGIWLDPNYVQVVWQTLAMQPQPDGSTGRKANCANLLQVCSTAAATGQHLAPPQHRAPPPRVVQRHTAPVEKKEELNASTFVFNDPLAKHKTARQGRKKPPPSLKTSKADRDANKEMIETMDYHDAHEVCVQEGLLFPPTAGVADLRKLLLEHFHVEGFGAPLSQADAKKLEKLQTTQRGKKVRREQQEQHVAAAKLQATMRGKHDRKLVATMRAEALLRAELRKMTISDLNLRAQKDGIGKQEIEHCQDADDWQGALIDLIAITEHARLEDEERERQRRLDTERAAKEAQRMWASNARAETQRKAAAKREQEEQERAREAQERARAEAQRQALREQLKQSSLKLVKQEARTYGVTEQEMEDAEHADDDYKGAIAELVVQKRIPIPTSNAAAPPPPPPPPAAPMAGAMPPASGREELLSALASGATLRHTESVDKSGATDMDALMFALGRGNAGSNLRHTETVEKTGAGGMDALMFSLSHSKGTSGLRHAETAERTGLVASDPNAEKMARLLDDLETGKASEAEVSAQLQALLSQAQGQPQALSQPPQ
jgi:hypothetical protein